LNLIQDKLDVKHKKRANLFNWRGQFTPEFIEYLLDNFASKGDFVVDPFSGSGTVLLESARKYLRSAGFEINPAAYAMSKFFTLCNVNQADRTELISKFELKLNNCLTSINELPVYINTFDYRESYKNLIGFAKNFSKKLESKQERVLLINMLFLSEKDKKLELKSSVQKSFRYIKESVLNLPYSKQLITAHLNDARIVGDQLTNQVDLIITSPPYINVFNYHQNYRALVEVFNFDILKIAHSEFGSNRMNRGNRFKTVIQYSIDMEASLISFWNALKPNGKLIMILGRESNVRKISFFNGQLLMDIMNAIGGFTDINNLERTYTNKFGCDIKEDILITQKTSEVPQTDKARKIALQHLKRGLETTSNGVESDIKDAIEQVGNVRASLMFNPNHIIINGENSS